jgi:hypothetical protein
MEQSTDSSETKSKRENTKQKMEAETEIRLRNTFRTYQKASKTDNEFLKSLNDEDKDAIAKIALRSLLDRWRLPLAHAKNGKFQEAKESVLNSIKPYFRLDDLSPIQGVKWGELTGTQWGQIGHKGMMIRRLLGPEKTAFELVGSEPGYDNRFNNLIHNIN